MALLPAVGVLVAAAFWHGAVFAGHRARLDRRVAAWLAVEPVVLLVLALTARWHGLFVADAAIDADGDFLLELGPAFWVHTAYSYTLLGAAIVLLVGASRRAVTGQRWQYVVAVAAMAVPTAANVLSVAAAPRGFSDLTSAAFVLTAGIWLVVEQRGTAMRHVPVSLAQVLDAIGDAVLVVDPTGTVVAANPAAEAMVAGHRAVGSLTGRHWSDLIDADRLAAIRLGQPVRLADGRVVDVRVSEVRADGPVLGSVVAVRDVSGVERLRSELAEQAVRDGLTGLHNRRHLQGALESAVAHARATGRPLAAVMLDLDHFKQVNDTYGHAAGNRLLVDVAGVLAAHVRDGDVLVRFGGEEFLALVPGVARDELERRLELVRAACAAVRVDAPPAPPGHPGPPGSTAPPAPPGPTAVTVSIGAARLTDEMTPDDLLRAADDALYAAKSADRDRVVVA